MARAAHSLPPRPRLLVASIQGPKSLPQDSIGDIEAAADVRFEARTEPYAADELSEAAADVDILAITPKVSPVIDEPLLRAMPRLRGIALHATGYDFVDTDALARHDVALSTLPSYSTRSVAEQTLGLLLAMASRLHLGNDRSRGMVDHGVSLRGVELHGRTLGIIGCGRIGGTVARLAQGIGMITLAHDVDPKPVPGVSHVGRDELLTRAHVLTLHCPLPFGAPPMIGARELDRLPPGAFVINSSRSALVDDHAMAAAIVAGRIRGYAVDDEVFDPRYEELLTEGRVLQTGHSAWWTDEVLERGSAMWADSILAMVRGEPINLVSARQPTDQYGARLPVDATTSRSGLST
jgi:phosphoglycerate dehydrogenase-like enzyme